MPLPRVILVRGEQHKARRVIHCLHSQHLKVALGQLPLQLGIRRQRILLVKTVEVEMRVPVAPARPQEAVSRFQDLEVVIHVDPRARTGLG